MTMFDFGVRFAISSAIVAGLFSTIGLMATTYRRPRLERIAEIGFGLSLVALAAGGIAAIWGVR